MKLKISPDGKGIILTNVDLLTTTFLEITIKKDIPLRVTGKKEGKIIRIEITDE